MPTVRRAPRVHDDGVKFQGGLMGRLQELAEVEHERKLHELADLPHGVGEPLELEGGDLRDGLKQKALPGVGFLLAVFAEVLVIALELIDCEEAADALD